MQIEKYSKPMSTLKHILATCCGIICLLFFAMNANGQEQALNLKYLGTAGWEMTDGNVTILIDPYISRLKLGNGPSTSKDDSRKSFARLIISNLIR